MKHWAEVSEGTVSRVTVSNDESVDGVWLEENVGGQWVEVVDGTIVGPGFLYVDGGFREPSPFPSWVWDDVLQEWVAPIPMPTDGAGEYFWHEATGQWVLIPA